jgi:hypothetical protein
VAVNKASWVTIRHMDESLKRLRLEDDAAKSTATFVDGKGDTAKREVFTYTRPDAESLVLTGSFQGVPVEARLKKVDESKILLLNRGFNWVQEFPFNR